MTTYPPGGNAILVEETDTTPVIVRREDAVPIHVGITIVEDIEVVPGVAATIIEEDIDLQGLQVEEVHEGVQGDIKEEVEIEIKVGVKAEVVIIKNQRVGIDQMRVTILEIMIINLLLCLLLISHPLISLTLNSFSISLFISLH